MSTNFFSEPVIKIGAICIPCFCQYAKGFKSMWYSRNLPMTELTWFCLQTIPYSFSIASQCNQFHKFLEQIFMSVNVNVVDPFPEIHFHPKLILLSSNVWFPENQGSFGSSPNSKRFASPFRGMCTLTIFDESGFQNKRFLY